MDALVLNIFDTFIINVDKYLEYEIGFINKPKFYITTPNLYINIDLNKNKHKDSIIPELLRFKDFNISPYNQCIQKWTSGIYYDNEKKVYFTLNNVNINIDHNNYIITLKFEIRSVIHKSYLMRVHKDVLIEIFKYLSELDIQSLMKAEPNIFKDQLTDLNYLVLIMKYPEIGRIYQINNNENSDLTYNWLYINKMLDQIDYVQLIEDIQSLRPTQVVLKNDTLSFQNLLFKFFVKLNYSGIYGSVKHSDVSNWRNFYNSLCHSENKWLIDYIIKKSKDPIDMDMINLDLLDDSYLLYHVRNQIIYIHNYQILQVLLKLDSYIKRCNKLRTQLTFIDLLFYFQTLDDDTMKKVYSIMMH